MSTINPIGNALKGVTGTGNFVGSNSPTITTPILVGVTDGSSAAFGDVGEFRDSNTSGPTAFSSSSSAQTFQTLSLDAGDWDVYGLFTFTNNGSTTTYTQSTLSLTTNALNTICSTASSSFSAIAVGQIGLFQFGRVSVSTTTNIYLVGFAVYTVATPNGYGSITARRVR